MKKMTKEGGSNLEQHTLRLRMTPIAAACSALLFASSAAYAQQVEPAKAEAATAEPIKVETKAATFAKEAPDQQGPTTIVVTGIRHAIETSVAAKRNSEAIVESVSAEDIGKLPDVSIAEAISRLPGIAAQNINGHAQVIAIRGLAPDFTGTLLNGREQTTTGGNRGVEFDQYPAELMSSVLVYKTADGALLGSNIAGTVDMRTVRPLDYSERKVALNARLQKNSLGDLNHGYGGTSGMGGRFSASYIDQFVDRTVGVSLGYAHLDSPGQQQHYKAWWWGAPGNNGAPTCWMNCAVALGGAEMTAVSRQELRDGLMGTIEFRPSKNFHSTIDAYASKFNQTEVMRGLMFDSNPWNDAAQPGRNTITSHSLTNPGYTGVGGAQVLSSGTITFPTAGTQPVVRNDYNTRDDRLKSIGWNTEAKLGDWKGIADLSYSSANRKESLFETYAGTPTSSINFNVFPTGGSDWPSYTSGTNFANPATVALGDPAGWSGSTVKQDGKKQLTELNDTIKALNLHVQHKLGWIFKSIDAGVNYSEHDKTQDFHVLIASLPNNGTPQLINPSMAMTPTSLGFVGIPGVLSYDVNQIASQYYTMSTHESNGPSGDLSHNFGVHEKVTTAYAKLDIDTELGNIPVHGNLGAQFVHTNQSSNALAFSASKAPLGAFVVGTSYNNVLPSLNLIGDLASDVKLRFGLAKTMARGRITDLNASYGAGVDVTTHLWSGGGGNPKLKPWLANSIDFSLEKYFGKSSYVSGAVFYKDLLNYVYKKSIAYDFTGYINPTPLIVPISNIGMYSTNTNGTGGTMKGAELTAQLDGGQLTKALDGFGASVSTSYTETSIQVTGPGSATPMWATLPGLSKIVAGLTLYYDDHGYSVRINDRYRSAFRGEFFYLFGNTSTLRTLAMNTIDLQLGHEFQEGALKGAAVSFQVTNLTDAKEHNIQDGTNFGTAAAPQETNNYGRGMLLGLSYKF